MSATQALRQLAKMLYFTLHQCKPVGLPKHAPENSWFFFPSLSS